MKKLYFFLTLLMMSGFIFGQSQQVEKTSRSSEPEGVKINRSLQSSNTVLEILNFNQPPCPPITTFPWIESFEGATFPPDCWTKVNPDSGTGWASVAAGTSPLPGWTGGTMTVPTSGGTKAAYCTWTTGGLQSNDQWLISPKIAIQTNQELSFYIFFNYPGYYDVLDVKVSTTGTNTSDFTDTLISIDSDTYAAGAWTKVAVSLAAYAGQNIYIAFNEYVDDNMMDGNFLAIDLVSVDLPATNPIAECSPLFWNVGDISTGDTAISGTFTLSNIGGGLLTCSGITGLSAPFTTTLISDSVSLGIGATKTFTFSYSPTIVGPNSQTVVIATTGGNITIDLNGAGVNCGTPISTFPWVESFEGTSFPPACWSALSPDGGTGWARIIAGTTPLPGWTGGTMTVPTSGGTAATYCTYTTGGMSSNDQWLITPQIAVQTNQELSFYIISTSVYADIVDVKISTTGNNPTNFTTTLLSIATETYTANEWKRFAIPLSAYAGQNIYIAFNEHIADNFSDGSFIGLDLVTVDAAPTTPIADCTPLAWNAGNVIITETATSGTFTLKNVGGATLTCSGITGLIAPFTTTLVPSAVNLAAGATQTFTFSYNPTVAGTNNQTVVLATNGGDITISLTGAGVTCTPITSFPWVEDFEETSFPPVCWTVVNHHASSVSNWHAESSEGNGSAEVNYSDENMMQERLITPFINLSGQTVANLSFSFYMSYYWMVDPENGADVKVEVSTDGGTNWTTIWTEADYGVFENWTWYDVSIPLTEYLGQSNVKVSFYYVGNDGAQCKIDDVGVTTTVAVNEHLVSTSVYPNPASNFVTFSAQENINKVEIFNLVGQLVYSNVEENNEVMVNVNNLSNGVYIAKIHTATGISNHKFNVLK